MPLRALAEAFMPLLAAELGIRLPQHGQPRPAAGDARGGTVRIGGMGASSHGRTTRGTTC